MKNKGHDTLPKDLQSCICRLERSYRDLLQCRVQMKNYRNEPVTYHWYKTKTVIGDKITLLLEGHWETMQLLKEKKTTFSKVINSVTHQLKAARHLSQNVMQYTMLHNDRLV